MTNSIDYKIFSLTRKKLTFFSMFNSSSSDQPHVPKIGWKFIYYFATVMIDLSVVIVEILHQGRLKAPEVLLASVYTYILMQKMYLVVSKVDTCLKLPNQLQVRFENL